MHVLARVLAVLAALVLGAHVLRMGYLVPAVLLAASPLLLLVRKPWARLAFPVVLAAGAVEWLRTLALLVAARRAEGLPYTRLALILGAVALVTGLAAALLLAEAAGRRRLAEA